MTTAEHDLRARSTGDLVKTLSRQVSLLVRQEIQLAKTELKEKAADAGVGAAALAGAAVAGLLALGALTAFLILALDGAMPAWAAALLVGVLWALGAMLGAATYFVISADLDNGLPPISLAAAGLGGFHDPARWPLYPAPGGLVFPALALVAVLALNRLARDAKTREAPAQA